MGIDIGIEWFGIGNRQISYINNRVIAIDSCRNRIFLNIFTTNGQILIKFCMGFVIYLDVYILFFINLTGPWPLLKVGIVFVSNILWINRRILIKFVYKCIYVDKI